MGLSYCRTSGLLSLAVEKDGANSKAVQVTAACVRTAYRCSVYVRLADSGPIFCKTCTRTTDPSIYKSYCYYQFLGDVSACSCSNSLSFYMRVHDRLLFGV